MTLLTLPDPLKTPGSVRQRHKEKNSGSAGSVALLPVRVDGSKFESPLKTKSIFTFNASRRGPNNEKGKKNVLVPERTKKILENKKSDNLGKFSRSWAKFPMIIV